MEGCEGGWELNHKGEAGRRWLLPSGCDLTIANMPVSACVGPEEGIQTEGRKEQGGKEGKVSEQLG